MNTTLRTGLTVFFSITALLALAGCGGSREGEADHADHSHDSANEQAEHGHAHGPDGSHTHAAQEFVKDPGPNRGRLITAMDPAVEFLLLPDRRAQLTFVDSAGKAIAAAQQEASLTTGDRMNPVQIGFERDGDALVSTKALPEIEGMPVVLALKSTPEAAPVVERFNLKTHTCSGCQLSEYACICGH